MFPSPPWRHCPASWSPIPLGPLSVRPGEGSWVVFSSFKSLPLGVQGHSRAGVLSCVDLLQATGLLAALGLNVG